MALLRQNKSSIVISSLDNVIYCNIHEQKDLSVQIPEPITPESTSKSQPERRNITSVEFSRCGEFIAVATENKQLIVYNSNLNVVKHFNVNRVTSKVCFTPTNDVVVADRTGDVYLYHLNNENETPTLLLGHLSVILDVIISDCGKFIITCDRDEKIRCSHFPNAYNIVSYCLGHTEFVVTLKMVKNTLISASGDGTVRFWNFQRGEQLGIINTNDYIQDKKMLENFTNEMDQEKVDISCLPITDMQVHESYNLFIACTLHKCNWIQLYATDLKSCKSIYLRKIEVNSNYCDPITYSFGKYLYILTDRLTCFELVNENYQNSDCIYIDKFYQKYADVFNNIIKNQEQITVLYKRKYDNVQEYMERKKQRLQLK